MTDLSTKKEENIVLEEDVAGTTYQGWQNNIKKSNPNNLHDILLAYLSETQTYSHGWLL